MVKNLSKKRIIAEHYELCETAFSKFRGLMFEPSPKTLIFRFNRELRISIHMFFVFFPIDLLFLDSKKSIIEMKESLKPWKIYKSINKAKFVIELPGDTIKNTRTKVGDRLYFRGGKILYLH